MHKSNTLNRILWIMICASALGFFDAFYLTIKHYTNTVPACSIITGCEVVTTSQYSYILGIPVALLGTFYYASILVNSGILLHKKNSILKKMLSYWTVTGLLASIWFVSLQLFVIHAICLYCIGSAVSSTLLFICGLLLKKVKE